MNMDRGTNMVMDMDMDTDTVMDTVAELCHLTVM